MEIEMTIKTLMIDPYTTMPIVVLRETEGERLLPIWIGAYEANAIALEIEKVETPRPMTHDLLKRIVDAFGGEVERIVVCELKENTFYAAIYMNTGRGSVTIDARPSDAIALALRTRSKIFVEDTVIQRARQAEANRDSSRMSIGKLQEWLENLSEDELGKYKM
jgi:bifunctional DNase/RNase